MRYLKITSAVNPHIREVIRIREKRAKFRHTAFLIEGPRLVEMAVDTGTELKQVFFTDSFAGKREGQALLRRAAEKTRELFEVTDQVLNKIADTETPQGIVSVVRYRHRGLDELSVEMTSLLVVIDAIQDPGNLGTIVRTADAAGADAVVILPGTCDAFMPKAVRATAGSIFTIPLVYTEADVLLKWLRTQRVKLVITAPEGGLSVFEAPLTGALAVTFGNEAHGVSRKLRDAADIALKIPIYGRAESLNVATSAAVCLYEIVRQRQT